MATLGEPRSRAAAHSMGCGTHRGQNLDADASDRFGRPTSARVFAQFGKDWTLSHDTNGEVGTHAGATLTFGSTSASFSDSARSIAGLSDSTGTVETQAQSIGGYWTKYLPDGSYFDGVGAADALSQPVRRHFWGRKWNPERFCAGRL